MTIKDRELFVHCQDAKPQVIHADGDERLRDVLVRAGVIQEGKHDLLIFVSESDAELLKSSDTKDGIDNHDPVDANLPIEKLGTQQRHIHCYGCRHVAVDVNFGGRRAVEVLAGHDGRCRPAVGTQETPYRRRRRRRLHPARLSHRRAALDSTSTLANCVGDMFALLRLGQGSHAAGVKAWSPPISASLK